MKPVPRPSVLVAGVAIAVIAADVARFFRFARSCRLGGDPCLESASRDFGSALIRLSLRTSRKFLAIFAVKILLNQPVQDTANDRGKLIPSEAPMYT